MVRLPNRRSANGLPTFSLHRLLPISIDQLDRADVPLIPEAYIYLLGVQYLVSLSDGITGYSFPLYNTIVVQKLPTGSTEPVRAGPTRPYDAPRDQASPLWAKNCARDAERWLARTSCDPLLPLFHRLRPLLGDVLGAL